MKMRWLSLLLFCPCWIAPAARADQPDAYHAHYPPHYFFGFYAPPAPSAQGRFGFDSGEDRGFAGQYLRENDENYGRSHGLKDSAQAECSDPYACPCPSPYYRNSTNCAPIVIPPRPDDEED
jgi:hypothetical protein